MTEIQHVFTNQIKNTLALYLCIIISIIFLITKHYDLTQEDVRNCITQIREMHEIVFKNILINMSETHAQHSKLQQKIYFK